MNNKLRKIKQYLKVLDNQRRINKSPVDDILTCPCDYKIGHTPPSPEHMTRFENGSSWGTGLDSHAWFRFSVTPSRPNTLLRIETERNGWDADNPQFIIYINGKMVQGLDTNHRELPLDVGQAADVALYAYTGPKVASASLYVNLVELCPEVEGLYYDIKYPLEMLDYLDSESTEYSRIVDYLWHAVSMLELYSVGSEEFAASVTRAREFLTNEFYGKYCWRRKQCHCFFT